MNFETLPFQAMQLQCQQYFQFMAGESEEIESAKSDENVNEADRVSAGYSSNYEKRSLSPQIN